MFNATLSFRSILIVATLAGAVTLSVPTLRADDDPTDLSTSEKTPLDTHAPALDMVEGTLIINDTSYKLTHLAIYETNVCDEPLWVTILASSKPIPLDKLTDSLKKDGTDDDFHYFKPHIRLSYNTEGKLVSMFAWADNHNIYSSDDDLKGDFVNEDGRITGTSSLKPDEGSSINCDYNLKFSGDLIKATEIADKPESIAVKPGSDKPAPSRNTIEGTLSVNGVSYKPTHLVIYETTIDTNGFDEKRIKVHASCKPIALDKLTDSLRKDGTDSHFYDSHPHLVLSFDTEGKLLDTFFQMKHNGIYVSGETFNGELEVEDGRVNGSASHNTVVNSTEFDFALNFSGNLFKVPEIEDNPESIAEKPDADKPDISEDLVEGTLDVNGVSYNLAHYVIYEETVDTNGFDVDRIIVLASCDPIPPEILTDEYFFFLKPQLVLSFDTEGKLRDIDCRANNNEIHIGADNLNGEIEVQEGRVRGSASYKPKVDDSTKLAFELKFAGDLQKTSKAEGDLASGGGC